jgi:hypothetical protein
MKNLFKTLTLIFSLSLSFSGNSQIIYGNGGIPFDGSDNDFSVEVDNFYYEYTSSVVEFTNPTIYSGVIKFTITKNIDNFDYISVTLSAGINLNDIELPSEYVVSVNYTMTNDENDSLILTYDNSNSNYTSEPFTQTETIDTIEVVINKSSSFDQTIYKLKEIYLNGQDVTSVKENNLEESFNVFSYNKNLSVETDEYKDYTLQVYNLSGRLVLDENTNGNFNTNISQSGIYIVKLRSEDGVLTKKIFIE